MSLATISDSKQLSHQHLTLFLRSFRLLRFLGLWFSLQKGRAEPQAANASIDSEIFALS